MSAQPKTHGQVKAIFAEGKKRGLDGESLRDTVESVTRRTRHIRDLTYSEAEQIIQKLKGEGFVPRRTLQYRRAKQGIKQVVQESQLKLIAELASQRNWSAETLKNFCKRQCKHERPRTTEDANKVIEALKSMNKRDDLWAA
jgi:DNA-directed RNA polymerase subunit F